MAGRRPPPPPPPPRPPPPPPPPLLKRGETPRPHGPSRPPPQPQRNRAYQLMRGGALPGGRQRPVGPKSQKVQLIDLLKATDTEALLKKLKMPVPDMLGAVLAMDDSVIDGDLLSDLIMCCPTKKEMALLKRYTRDKSILGRCEQYFLELMKVPRIESKFRIFSFKIHFNAQTTELKHGLNAVQSVCKEVRNSQKLKEIMRRILYLGNILDQGTSSGAAVAVGVKLDSLLKLTDTRANNNKITLLHYLCKVLASTEPALLDFYKDLESLESTSKIQLKELVEIAYTLSKGLEKIEPELAAAKCDGPLAHIFYDTLKDFLSTDETEVQVVFSIYAQTGRNADALSYYFGEDPSSYPFEQVIATLLDFVRLFKKAHEENVKQEDPEKGVGLTREYSPLEPLQWVKTSALQGSLWDELQRRGEGQIAPEFDVSEIESLFSSTMQKPADKSGGSRNPNGDKA